MVNLEVVGGSAVAEFVSDEVLVLVGVSVGADNARVGFVVFVVFIDNRVVGGLPSVTNLR